jgi:hypothetical protein
MEPHRASSTLEHSTPRFEPKNVAEKGTIRLSVFAVYNYVSAGNHGPTAMLLERFYILFPNFNFLTRCGPEVAKVSLNCAGLPDHESRHESKHRVVHFALFRDSQHR